MTASPQTALFHIFDQYSFGIVLSLIAIVLLIIFFITSADSATFVLAMLTSNGNLEPGNSKKNFLGHSDCSCGIRPDYVRQYFSNTDHLHRHCFSVSLYSAAVCMPCNGVEKRGKKIV